MFTFDTFIYIIGYILSIYVVYDVLRNIIIKYITPYNILDFCRLNKILLNPIYYQIIINNPNFEIWNTSNIFYHYPSIIWCDQTTPVIMMRNPQNIHLYTINNDNCIIKKISTDILNIDL